MTQQRHTGPRLLLATVLGLTLTGTPAHALMAVTDAALLAKEILTVAQTAKSNMNEAMQIENQIRQYTLMIRNLEAVPQSILLDIQRAMTNYRSVLTSGRDLTYKLQDLQRQWDALYGQVETGAPLPDFIRDAAKQVTDSSQTAMRTQAIDTNLADIQRQLQLSLAMSDNGHGNKDIQQAGNQIAGLQVQVQAAALEMQAAQNRAQASFLARLGVGEQAAEAEARRQSHPVAVETRPLGGAAPEYAIPAMR